MGGGQLVSLWKSKLRVAAGTDRIAQNELNAAVDQRVNITASRLTSGSALSPINCPYLRNEIRFVKIQILHLPFFYYCASGCCVWLWNGGTLFFVLRNVTY